MLLLDTDLCTSSAKVSIIDSEKKKVLFKRSIQKRNQLFFHYTLAEQSEKNHRSRCLTVK